METTFPPHFPRLNFTPSFQTPPLSPLHVFARGCLSPFSPVKTEQHKSRRKAYSQYTVVSLCCFFLLTLFLYSAIGPPWAAEQIPSLIPAALPSLLLPFHPPSFYRWEGRAWGWPWILHIHNWLHSCYWQQNFHFDDHGTLYEGQQLFGRYGTHLTKQGKSIFANRLANLAKKL